MYVTLTNKLAFLFTQLDMGRSVPSIHESGRVESNCLGLCQSPWMIQNVKLNLVNYGTISSAHVRGVHCAYTEKQNFINSKFSRLLRYFLYQLNMLE